MYILLIVNAHNKYKGPGAIRKKKYNYTVVGEIILVHPKSEIFFLCSQIVHLSIF